MLADDFEDRSKDKHRYGPLERLIWRTANRELVKALGRREIPGNE
jgi:hypothetical protein